MAMQDMFFAMILQNARRAEARGVVLTVDREESRIDMLLLDGSCQPLTAPPAAVLMKIIESLERGQRAYTSNVFTATIETVHIQRGLDNTVAHIERWNMGHADDDDDF